MGSTYTYPELRQQLVDAAAHLVHLGVLSHSGHANLSVRIDQERMVLTNTGMIRNLTTDQLAVVNFDGKVEEGTLEPTNAEIVSMHTAVYQARRDVNAIIHTHSPHVTAFALANAPLPARYEALLRFGQAETTPVVPWGPRGSDASVRGIVEALRQHPQTMAVLLGNHGLLAFGSSPGTTSMLVAALEEAAEAELDAAALGGAKEFPAGALEDVRRSISRVRA
jgi:L-ribulose-5-phosphate 4-epimerase